MTSGDPLPEVSGSINPRELEKESGFPSRTPVDTDPSTSAKVLEAARSQAPEQGLRVLSPPPPLPLLSDPGQFPYKCAHAGPSEPRRQLTGFQSEIHLP